MWRQVDRWGWIALLLAVSFGCGSPSSGGSGGQNVSMEELTKQLQKQSGAAAPKPATPMTPATPAAPANAVAEGRTEQGAIETATVDVPADAKKASDKGPQRTQGGYMGAVIGANRNIREALSDVSWQKSVQLYEASNGHKPRNTQEFLELVRGEGTPLPEIPQGMTYLYVPEEGQFGQLYQVPAGQTGSEPSPGR
jgi:hypothetical protein